MKKSLPLNLRKALETILDKNRELIKIEATNDSMIEFTDIDINSNFSFVISKMKESGKTMYYEINYLPKSGNDLKRSWHTSTLTDLKTHLNNWIELLKDFNKPSILFEGDEIEKAYYDELEPLIEILEEDADTSPFSYCLLYTSPSPRDATLSRMPSSA